MLQCLPRSRSQWRDWRFQYVAVADFRATLAASSIAKANGLNGGAARPKTAAAKGAASALRVRAEKPQRATGWR